MTWSPRISTQLCLASEDDSYPVIQLWDLRMATGAIKVFSGHRKSVNHRIKSSVYVLNTSNSTDDYFYPF